jgi:hypothetical protein
MGFTKLGDPFVSSHQTLWRVDARADFWLCRAQVGPVKHLNGSEDQPDGQFIAAGYSGHGMPRAYAW